jgi:hypothetical protein
VKRCRDCGQEKPLDEFYPQPWGDGRRGICRKCHTVETVRSRYRRTQASCPTAIARFLSRVQLTATCWVWRGATTSAGYGLMRLPMKPVPVYAHRFSYVAHIGPISQGLTIDHLCRNRACVNPEHLEPVTNAENNRRGAESRRKAAAA